MGWLLVIEWTRAGGLISSIGSEAALERERKGSVRLSELRDIKEMFM